MQVLERHRTAEAGLVGTMGRFTSSSSFNAKKMKGSK